MYNVSFPGLGLEFQINRVAFTIGDSFAVYWYAILITTGVVLALLYAHFNSKRFGCDMDKVLNCFIVGLITAIIGARLYYVAFSWEDYASDPISILHIRDGGIAIYGAIIGALIGGLAVAKIQKMKLLPLVDMAMICFLIGQAVGRWGNFMNQEAYGTETDSLFRMVSEGTNGVAVHPCFLYESVWCALGVLLLHIFSKKWQKYYGQVTFLYMIWYGFERMIVEGLRTDSLYMPFKVFGFDIRVSQVLSFALVIAGIILLIVFRKRDDHIEHKRKTHSLSKDNDKTDSDNECDLSNETDNTEITDSEIEQIEISEAENV